METHKPRRYKSANGHDVTKQEIIDVNSIVSGRNCDILTSIIAQLLTSRPFPDLWASIMAAWDDSACL